MGTGDRVASLGRILRWVLFYAAVLVPAAMFTPQRGRLARITAVVTLFTLTAMLATAWLTFGWLAWFDDRGVLQCQELPQPWQLLLLLVGMRLASLGCRPVEPVTSPATPAPRRCGW